MNDKQSELTSALLDGELDPDAQQRAIIGNARCRAAGARAFRALPADRRCDARRIVVRRQRTVAERVHRALIDEPVVLAPPARPAKRWLRPVAGLAVAASVATAAVFVAPQLMTQSGGRRRGRASWRDVRQLAASPVLVAAGSACEYQPLSTERATVRCVGRP